MVELAWTVAPAISAVLDDLVDISEHPTGDLTLRKATCVGSADAPHGRWVLGSCDPATVDAAARQHIAAVHAHEVARERVMIAAAAVYYEATATRRPPDPTLVRGLAELLPGDHFLRDVVHTVLHVADLTGLIDHRRHQDQAGPALTLTGREMPPGC